PGGKVGMGGTGGTEGSAGSSASVDAAMDAESGSCSGLMCDGACVADDIHNCGACGHDCTLLSHVSGPVTCNAGQCSFPLSSCASPWSHCSTNADDGCETDTSKTDNCGACGKVCPTATPLCALSGGSY